MVVELGVEAGVEQVGWRLGHGSVRLRVQGRESGTHVTWKNGESILFILFLFILIFRARFIE